MEQPTNRIDEKKGMEEKKNLFFDHYSKRKKEKKP